MKEWTNITERYKNLGFAKFAYRRVCLMPKSNSALRNPDPFIMNEDTVNAAIANFLKSKGFDCESPLTGRQQGIDVKASKGSIQIFVESKGSQEKRRK